MEIEIKVQHPIKKYETCDAHPDENCRATWMLLIGQVGLGWSGERFRVCEPVSEDWDYLKTLYEARCEENENDSKQLLIDEACGH